MTTFTLHGNSVVYVEILSLSKEGYMNDAKLSKQVLSQNVQLPTAEELLFLKQQGFAIPKQGFTIRNGLIVPNQHKYSRILLTGSTGSGKSTTTDALAEQTGYPHLHTDLHRFDSDFATVPDEVLANTIVGFVKEHPAWILDYTRTNNDYTLLNWLLTKTDLALHFDFTPEDSKKGYLKKEADFKNGIPPRGLPNNPKFFGEDVVRFLGEVNNRQLKELPDLRKKLHQSGAEIKTMHTYADVDKFLTDFERDV